MQGQFKKSLFGYSKQSVHRYISRTSEEFSQKLMAKEKEKQDALQALNEELARLKEENEQLKAERGEVAKSLIDAEAFADELKQKAEQSDREQRAKDEELHRAELAHLQNLAEQIDRLRTEVRAFLSNTEEGLEQYTLLCKALHTEDEETV